jgi:hypothetical protein
MAAKEGGRVERSWAAGGVEPRRRRRRRRQRTRAATECMRCSCGTKEARGTASESGGCDREGATGSCSVARTGVDLVVAVLRISAPAAPSLLAPAPITVDCASVRPLQTRVSGFLLSFSRMFLWKRHPGSSCVSRTPIPQIPCASTWLSMLWGIPPSAFPVTARRAFLVASATAPGHVRDPKPQPHTLMPPPSRCRHMRPPRTAS